MAKAGARKGNPYKFTKARKDTFLSELERLGSYKAAAASIGVGVNTIYVHRKKDPRFEHECEQALNKLTKALNTVARKLAIEGVEELSYDRENRVIRRRVRYDTKILLRMLAARDPDNWSDTKKIEQTIKGRVDHEHSGSIDVRDLTPKQQRAAREMLKTDRNLN